MRNALLMVCFALAGAAVIPAAELQGVVVDWNCVKPMVKDGREKTLRNNPSCSLMRDYKRAAYGLITEDKSFYRLDDPGNQRILQLLKGNPEKDNLKVVVTGDINGDAIKVVDISML